MGPASSDHMARPRAGRASRRGGRSPPWLADRVVERVWLGEARAVLFDPSTPDVLVWVERRARPQASIAAWKSPGFRPATRGVSDGRPRAGTSDSCPRDPAPGARVGTDRLVGPPATRQIVRASPTSRQAPASGFASAFLPASPGQGDRPTAEHPAARVGERLVEELGRERLGTGGRRGPCGARRSQRRSGRPGLE